MDQEIVSRRCYDALQAPGTLCIVYYSRLEFQVGIVHETHKIIRQYNPYWNHGGTNGLYPEYLPILTRAGFKDIETFSFDRDISFTLNNWVGRIVASKGVGVALDHAPVARLRNDLEVVLAPLFNDASTILHRCFVTLAKKDEFP